MSDAPQYSEPVPRRLKHFPRDRRGFIVPYFVAWFDGEQEVERGRGVPDFRVVGSGVLPDCIRFRHCWLCGQPLGKRVAFVLGPMCVITRVNSEPPSHRDCAEYAMRVCPFLTKPNMRRNPSDYAMPIVPAAGEHSERNPGIMAQWMTDGATIFNAEQGRPGILFEVNDPFEVVWWREGRVATREEVTLGLAMAMPALEVQAARKGRDAMVDLERMSERALAYLPSG
jgi:hypothetical protein